MIASQLIHISLSQENFKNKQEPLLDIPIKIVSLIFRTIYDLHDLT